MCRRNVCRHPDLILTHQKRAEKLVEELKGQKLALDEKDRGTKFIIELPAQG